MDWKSLIAGLPPVRSLSGLAALGCLGASFGAGLLTPSQAWAWAGILALLILFCAAVGVAINGRAAGLLIDERNRVSLSRFQVSAWTTLVLSALLTAALARVRAGAADPLAITIPGDLLVAMGISAASFVSSPMLLSLKAGGAASLDLATRTATQLGDHPTDLAPVGQLYGRCDPARARWLDMLRGEETCNAAATDPSKVQQFLMTVMVLGLYGAGLWSFFASAPAAGAGVVQALPDFSPNMLWLIGLSHAGYLAYKAAPHGPATPAAAADAVG